MMIKIEAIVREEVFEDVKAALNQLGINGMTVYQVMGCGVSKGYTRLIRGQKVDINMLPKIKFEIVVSSEELEENVIKTIRETAMTGEPGDGKIFSYEIRKSMRIRTGERDEEALTSSQEEK